MKCPSCQSENISAVNKRGMEKILSAFRPSASQRCLSCGRNFNRFNTTFLVTLIVVVALGAAAWMMLTIFPFPSKKTLPVAKTVSEPAKVTKSETKPIKITIPKPIKSPAKELSTETNVPVAEKTPEPSKKSIVEIEPAKPEPGATLQTQENTKTSPADIAKETGTSSTETAEHKDTTLPPIKTDIPEKEVSKTSETVATNMAQPETTTQKQTEAQPTEPVNNISSSETDQKVITEQQSSGIKILKEIKVQTVNGENQIVILTNSPDIEYKYFFLNYPSRMVIDLLGNWEQPKFLSKDMKNDIINQVRLWKHDDKLRLVSDLNQETPVQPTFKKTPEGLVVILK